MAHHFEPNDRDPTFGSLDLGSSSFASAISRLTPRAEAEARFFAHIALSNLPPHHNSFTPEESLEKARERYTDFLTNIFEPEHQPEGTVELNIVASYLSRERDIVLASVRDRSTGDLLLPRPDDILKLDGDRLVANARRFEEDTFCGILFDITPQESNYVVVATPVVLPHLMRREAIRFHNGDQDSLVKELLSRFARQELGSPPQFRTALVADDESKEGLVLLLTDERGRK